MKFLYLPILILFLSCSNKKLEEPQTYTDVAMQIMHKTSLQLKKEKNLHAYGSGGSMLYCVEMMYLGFQVYEDYTFEQKRELVVCALETLLQNVNNNKKISKDLCQYPFKIKNLEITLSFESKQDVVNPEGITFIAARDDVIKYYHNPPTGYGVLIHEETFEEAKEKLDQNKIFF